MARTYSVPCCALEKRGVGSFERIEAIRCAHYLAPDGLAVVSSQMVIPVTVSSGSAQYPANAEERLKERFPRLVYLDADRLALEPATSAPPTVSFWVRCPMDSICRWTLGGKPCSNPSALNFWNSIDVHSIKEEKHHEQPVFSARD
jgi:hypothetical protein